MEQEDTVNIEEVTINLDCVKRELDEDRPDFTSEINDYKDRLKYENVSEENLDNRQEENNLIDYLNVDVMEQQNVVKLENTEMIITKPEYFYCNGCGENYDRFCQKCSSLSYILNNIPNLRSKSDLSLTPLNILEIRDISGNNRVFPLRTLPKNVIFGPFQGISAIESMNGLRWKIGDCKFANDENANWMKYVGCATNQFSKNLDIFQFAGDLYFETCRDIKENEELLMWCGEEIKFDKEEECYFVPVKKEEFPKTFACSLCCLGFRLERCLVEHKCKCPYGKYNGKIDDFEVVECCTSNVWLEKQEHLERHRIYCSENCNRVPHTLWSSVWIKSEDEVASCSITDTTINGETNISKDESNRKGQRKNKDAKNSTKFGKSSKIVNNDDKLFPCDFCGMTFGRKYHLKRHLNAKHSSTSEKEHKCSKCSYQTNLKYNLNLHMNIHKHSDSSTCEKYYKCLECSFQTDYKHHLKRHLNIHNDIKPYQCDICKRKLSQKGHLKEHMRNNHASEKQYKCSECHYQTNFKRCFTGHVNTHNDVKFQCDICKKNFNREDKLKYHLKNNHLEKREDN